MSSLQALAQIVSSGIESIQSACTARGVKYPELDDAYSPETTEVQNQFTAETARIIAAAYQLQWIETILGCNVIDVHALAYMSAILAGRSPLNFIYFWPSFPQDVRYAACFHDT